MLSVTMPQQVECNARTQGLACTYRFMVNTGSALKQGQASAYWSLSVLLIVLSMAVNRLGGK